MTNIECVNTSYAQNDVPRTYTSVDASSLDLELVFDLHQELIPITLWFANLFTYLLNK